MRLFKEDNYEVTFSDEALTIKVFKDLIKRDKHRSKENALKEIAFIYFYSDPRSDFDAILDDEERIKDIKLAVGLPEKWKIDDKVRAAIDFYIFHTETPSVQLLKELNESIEKVKLYLRTLDLNERDDKGKPVFTLDKYITSVDKIPGLISKVQNAKRNVDKEIDENEKILGNKKKTILEDSLVNFMK